MVDFQDAIRLARKVRRDLSSTPVALSELGLQDLYEAATQFLVDAGVELPDSGDDNG